MDKVKVEFFYRMWKGGHYKIQGKSLPSAFAEYMSKESLASLPPQEILNIIDKTLGHNVQPSE